MSTHNFLRLVALGALVLGSTVSAQNLGTPISEAEIAPWDISILPDGTGLPPGSGTPADGARIFAAKCSCATARTARVVWPPRSPAAAR